MSDTTERTRKWTGLDIMSGNNWCLVFCNIWEITKEGQKWPNLTRSSPPLKSLAHNKYQVGGRQLLLAINYYTWSHLHQTKPSFFFSFSLKHFCLGWINLRQEVNIPQNSNVGQLLWCCPVTRAFLVGFEKLSFFTMIASDWEYKLGDGQFWKRFLISNPCWFVVLVGQKRWFLV